MKSKSLETERSAEFCGRRSCSNSELNEATPAESQNKHVLPVLSDGDRGFSVASTELSLSVSSSVLAQLAKEVGKK